MNTCLNSKQWNTPRNFGGITTRKRRWVCLIWELKWNETLKFRPEWAGSRWRNQPTK